MDRWKAELGRRREKRRVEERRSEKRKSPKKEDADARKGRKVAKHCVFPMIWGSGGSKSRLAKAAGAEPAGQMRDEKLHAVVARSTFRSQNVQNTSAPDHFWELRCWKSARRSGAKHISKSKCTRHLSVGPLLEVETLKKCTPLWRKAHFEVKMYKTPQLRTTLEVALSKKCTPLWREAHFEVKMLKTPGVRTTFGRWDMSFRVAGARDCGSCQKWAKREGFVAFSTTTTTTPHYTTLQYTTLHYNYTFTTFHYTTLHYTPLHYTTLHYTTLHYTTLHYTNYNYNDNYNYNTIFTLRYTTLHELELLHYTTLDSTTLHYTEWHCTTDRQVDK